MNKAKIIGISFPMSGYLMEMIRYKWNWLIKTVSFGPVIRICEAPFIIVLLTVIIAEILFSSQRIKIV
jgi:hypothetical protein